MAARIGHHLLSELPFGRPPGKYLPLSIWLHLDTFLFGFEAAPNLPSGVRNCTPYSKFSELALKPLYPQTRCWERFPLFSRSISPFK